MWYRMLTERMMERLKQRAETHCERDVCVAPAQESKKTGEGRQEEHKRLKNGELGRERWVAEEAKRNSKRWRH